MFLTEYPYLPLTKVQDVLQKVCSVSVKMFIYSNLKVSLIFECVLFRLVEFQRFSDTKSNKRRRLRRSNGSFIERVSFEKSITTTFEMNTVLVAYFLP